MFFLLSFCVAIAAIGRASGPAACVVRLPPPRCRLLRNSARRVSLPAAQANCDTGTTEHGECGEKAPFITAALDAGVPLRDVQEAASHADPRTTMRYDRARGGLNRHATYIVAAGDERILQLIPVELRSPYGSWWPPANRR